MERRTEVIQLNHAQIQGLLDAATGGWKLTDFRLLTAGRANTNYHLLTDAGECVLRLYARDASSCAKEVALTQRLTGLPVPAVLGEGVQHGLPPYALFEFKSGRPLHKWLTQKALPGSTARNLGQLLAKLSTHSFDQSGDLRVKDGELSTVPWEFGDSALTGFFRWCLFESPAGARLGKAVRDALWEVAQREAEREDGLPPTLSHGDFNPTNLLVDESGRITALLDWEFAHAGGPLSDIGNLLRARDYSLPMNFIVEFESGMREGGLQLPDDWLARAAFVDLSSACEFLSSAEDKPKQHAAAKRQVLEYLNKPAGGLPGGFNI